MAAHYGGHPFEEKYSNLSELELFILYKQVRKEKSAKNEEKKDMFEYIFKNFRALFDELQLFVNPKMFDYKLQIKERNEKLGEQAEEINEDNFGEIWDEMMKIIPQEYVIEDTVTFPEHFIQPKDDGEFEELLSGWVEKSSKIKK